MSAQESYGELPELLATVVEHAGLPAAQALAKAFGGRRVYMPRPDQLDEDHPVAKALLQEGVELEEARRLAAIVGYGKVDVPFGPFVSLAAAAKRRRREIVRLLKSGEKSRSAIAAETVTTERTVYRVQAEEKDELPLFPKDRQPS